MKQEAQVVILPTEDKTNIFRTNHQFIHYTTNNITGGLRYQHLYITSNEEVKKGDWFILDNTHIKEANENTLQICGKENCKKIIATTDTKLKVYEAETLVKASGFSLKTDDILLPQIQQSFLEEYCRRGGISEVEVEYETYDWDDGSKVTIPKINLNNTINLSFIEEKMYSREEVKTLLFISMKYADEMGNRNAKQWIEENL